MNEEIYVQNIISSINQITQDACTVLFLGKSFDNGLMKCFIVRKVPMYVLFCQIYRNRFDAIRIRFLICWQWNLFGGKKSKKKSRLANF